MEAIRSFVTEAAFFGAFLSLAAYEVGVFLKKKTGLAICNPLLISILLVIGLLSLLGVDYDSYNAGARYISYLLTPATVCLAIPLYEQLHLLKENMAAILCGILTGILTTGLVVLTLSILFGLDHEMYVTLLPKSITTAIGMGVSEEMGGIVTITVAVIILTGVLGNIIAETVCRIFRITDPVAMGIGIGSASHAIGTARAMEMGEIQGAMSSLSIAVSGILTVIAASFFAMLH